MNKRHILFFLSFLLITSLFSTPTRAGGGGAFSSNYPDFYVNIADPYCIKGVKNFFGSDCDAAVKYCLNKLFECSVKNKDYSCVITSGNEISCLQFPADCMPPDQTAELSNYKSSSKDACHKLTDALSIHKPGCGNDVLEPTEVCDDGNLLDGDTCPKDCQAPKPNLCGNGKMDDPNEECDAGAENGNVESGCDLKCKKISAPPVSANSSEPPAATNCSLHPGERPLSPLSSALVLSPVMFLFLRKKRVI